MAVQGITSSGLDPVAALVAGLQAATAAADAATAAATAATTAANAATAAANAAVPTSRLVSAGTGLTGGGSLAVDRSLAVAYGTTGTTACVGDDARLSNTRVPTDASVTTAKVDGSNLTLDGGVP